MTPRLLIFFFLTVVYSYAFGPSFLLPAVVFFIFTLLLSPSSVSMYYFILAVPCVGVLENSDAQVSHFLYHTE